MSEPIRLVVWDLDETFWHGTLTEGGMSYRRDTHDLVIALARRGIISSICSKNNRARVRQILEAEGIWDYFVLPSIAWAPKGPRIAAQVRAIQLRPPTILFIDDNPANLQEALHFVRGLQVADAGCIDGLLDDPRLQGREDAGLTRLAQYKLLEQRHNALAEAGGDAREFLRASRIRVQVMHDVAPHLDRAVELINRTNQLNFTKQRLPEDPAAAAASLAGLLAEFRIQAGLVRVTDRYGDHGLTGFYALDSVTNRLVHFCFSCRTQDMGVERWLYHRLGRPKLSVVGEVTTDIFEGDAPDWIDWGGADTADARPHGVLGRVLVRGGCDLQAVAHYLGPHAKTLSGEYHFARFGKAIRVDHSACLRLALDGITDETMAALRRIGYRREDFHTALAGPEAFDTYVFSFQSDAVQALYRHRQLGFAVPFGVPQTNNRLDLRAFPSAQMAARLHDPEARAALACLLDEYDFIGTIGEADFKANLERLLAATTPGAAVFILLGREHHPDGKPHPEYAQTNRWIADVAAASARDVRPMKVAAHIHAPADMIDINHFSPSVYHRLAEAVITSING
jgi:FkbH-like protein